MPLRAPPVRRWAGAPAAELAAVIWRARARRRRRGASGATRSVGGRRLCARRAMMFPTYVYVAAKRFVASLAFGAGSAHRNPDALAGRLLPWGARLLCRLAGALLAAVPPLRAWVGARYPGARAGSMAARTHFLDGSVRAAVADGAAQLVVLGAGFDTRARRLADELQGVDVFEVDLPAAQAAKREALRRAGLLDDWGAVFVPADFAKDDWVGGLQTAGCDLGAKRTHVLWEGCMFYLSEQNVKATLEKLRRPGVSVSFDFMDTSLATVQPESEMYGLVDAVRRAGEPWRFGIDFDKFHDWVEQRGWQVIDTVCGPEEVAARFFLYSEPGHEPFSCHGLATIRPMVMV